MRGALLALLLCAFSFSLSSALATTKKRDNFEHITHRSLPDHSLRIREPRLCDPSVKQYSGYLDVSDTKHLFFWFFESRSSPSTDPFVLWLNGGPGCTSATGLFFALGPCTIANNGTSTTPNPYSWNSNANVIFLDQPVGTGFSYSSQLVRNTPVAAADVYAFLQLFLHRFPEYASLPFHMATESYGGVYVPNIASVIHHRNKQLVYAPSSNASHGLQKINLKSIMLGNGLTDPLNQMTTIVDYACEGPFAVFEPYGDVCAEMRADAPVCERLIRECYRQDSRDTCMPAAVFCWQMLYGPLEYTGLNVYDVRMPCDPAADGPSCYRELPWIDVYLNTPSVQEELGIEPGHTFQGCNMTVNTQFLFQGDGMRNTASLLTTLVNEGIRLLVFAGNADMMCNYIGEERWVAALDSVFQREFADAPLVPWISPSLGRQAGVLRTAGGDGRTAGNVTYLAVFEAGHMVPHDQPEAALDMFNYWVQDRPLTT